VAGVAIRGGALEYRKLGQFQIERSVAKGGMGEVSLSMDDAGRPVALKTILEDLQHDQKFRDLFIREAEITFELDHKNIVKAYRFDEVGKRLVLVLEYLDGVNLKDVLRKIYDRKLHIPFVVVAAIMERVLDGLSYAHKKRDSKGKDLGIVHRDLNPSNIFLTYSGQVKILDFGISKATLKEVHQLTPKNELKGKISYLSPEQVRHATVDYRSDIFSLGIVLWEALSGKPLFLKDSQTAVMEAIVDGEYESILKHRPDLPPEVDQIIRKALKGSPKNRFQTCAEFKEALLEVVKKNYCPGSAETEISIFVKSLFGQMADLEDPSIKAGFSWLLAQIPGNEGRALHLAKELAQQYPTRPNIQLQLARVLLQVGDRIEGIRLMRRLARVDSLEEQIQFYLEWLGVRRRPVIPVLSRSHPLNHSLGWVRHKVLGPTEYQQQFMAA
jgi:serine/threonine protein kinase